ncbi:ABC transporter ATP-binding protein [Haloarculaceae archaeon H-GB2-1]|nr:ABC transporter ATP-binding protein [Haloarculaceae archaeon H-GB1-1]MEA5386703.1 ABC transporter ATP-binding protein [Haloarculaceae archaeon H-GB11]MEA5408230.1 ABC transporter ATP-binding protein [Haloarculaceae archaeon H-GB2-1]
MIDVDDVSVVLGGVEILNGVSVSVSPGEVVGLIGPNGAGKTTLLRTINGVLTPDSGSVVVDGDDVHTLPAREVGRRVATVPQDTSVAFDFPVEAVVEMGRTPYHQRLRGTDDDGAIVERALERTDTASLRDRPVSQLSGGQRQRVVLAQALAQETPALLLDEPTASLDIKHQVAMFDLLRTLVAEEEKAILTAIHDLDMAARYCDRLVLLADRTRQAAGVPSEVLTDDRLAQAFDVRTAVTTNPATGTPSVTPLGESQTDGAEVESPTD